MRSWLERLGVSLRWAALAALLFGAALTPAAEPTRVLFIGNSFTYVNDLPATFTRVAASLGRKVVTDLAAPGGYTLEQHAGDARTLAKIDAQPWDFVVLQEQSQRPALEPERVATFVIAPAVALDRRIHASYPHARTAFYETWGRENGDATYCATLPELCTYAGMQHRLSSTYATLSAQTSALLLPVGTAWAKLRATHPELQLYGPDGIHPSPLGTYLAACVLYDAFFGGTSAGAEAVGVTPAQAKLVQAVADATVRRGKAP